MPYYTGSATDLDDLLSILGARLSTNGWTIRRDGSYGSGYWLCAEPPSSSARVFHWITEYWDGNLHFNHPGPALWLLAGSAYDSGQPPENQPGLPPGAVDEKYSGSWASPINEYHLFITNSYAHAAARAGNGYWRHCLAGFADSTASNEVAYIQQCAWSLDSNQIDHWASNVHSCPWDNRNAGAQDPHPNWVWADDIAGWRKQSTLQSDYPMCRTCSARLWDNSSIQENSFFSIIADRSPNDFNGLSIFLPVPLALETAVDSGAYRLLGWASDARIVNMRDIAPADTIQIGTEDWLVFPAIVKNDPDVRDETANSGYFGMGYRKSIA